MTRIFSDNSPALVSPPRPPTTNTRPVSEDRLSMSEILDEVLASDATQGRSRSPPPAPLPSMPSTMGPKPHPPAPRGDISFDSLNLSELQTSSQATVQYDTEMDWTPTQSKHRVFNTYDPKAAQKPLRFGQAPIEENKGPFWYKVPPAPTTPAQRTFNPPNAARLRPSPVMHAQHAPFSSGASRNPFFAKKEDKPRRQVDFRDTSFFPTHASDQADPRNNLTDMFGNSFSLGDEQTQQAPVRDPSKSRETRATPSAKLIARSSELKKSRLPVRLTEIAVLSVCLLAWWHSTRLPHEYISYVRFGSACLCALIAFRATGEGVQDLLRQQNTGDTGRKDILLTLCGVVAGIAELVCACRIIFVLRDIAARESSEFELGIPHPDVGAWISHMNLGPGLIGVMIVHQLCGVAL